MYCMAGKFGGKINVVVWWQFGDLFSKLPNLTLLDFSLYSIVVLVFLAMDMLYTNCPVQMCLFTYLHFCPSALSGGEKERTQWK